MSEPFEEVPDKFEEVPDNLKTFIEDIGVFVPPDLSDEELEIILRGVHGHCMTCNSELGVNTIAMVSAVGIHMLFCQPACAQDHQVLAWLTETYDDIKSGVDFRGSSGAADRAE